MEPPKTLKVQIPEIRASVLRREDDERRGAGAGLLSKLGLAGGSGGGGMGGAAAGGGLLAGKAGIVAFLVAGSSVAAGVGGLFTISGSNAAAVHSAGVFAKADGPAPSDSAQAAANSAAAPDNGVSSSLDNFHQANRGAVPDPYAPAQPEQVKDAAAPAQAAGSASAVPDNTTTQSPGTTPPSSAPHPKMVKGQGFGGSAFSGGGSGASGGGLVAAGERPGATANFTHTTPGGTSAMRAERGVTGAQRRSAVGNGFNGATGQLLAHSNTLRSNLGSGMVSSAGSGAVMDGALASGNIGGHGSQISGGGAGTGGKGIDTSPGQNVSQSLRQVQPPPPASNNGTNKTPYQKTATAAMISLAIAGALLIVAGLMKKSKALAPYARYVAIASAAAAMAAVALGFVLFNKYGQTMQGMMIMGLGGITAFFAAKSAYDDFAADEAQKEQAAAMTQNKADFAKFTGDPTKGGMGYQQVNTVPNAQGADTELTIHGGGGGTVFQSPNGDYALVNNGQITPGTVEGTTFYPQAGPGATQSFGSFVNPAPPAPPPPPPASAAEPTFIPPSY